MSDVKPVTRYIEADVGVVEADETTREGEYVRADAYDLLAKERDHLSQRVAELEADAARYRHIRSEECGLTLKHDLLFGEELDRELDSEMAALIAKAAP